MMNRATQQYAKPRKSHRMMRMGVLAIVLLAMVGLGLKAVSVLLQSREGPGELAIRWEGAVNDRNYRDLGRSLNQCLGEGLFVQDRIFRAAQWFSGWTCEGVGNPDVILSLNHKPGDSERYYCRADGYNRVGKMRDSPVELNDLEFLETWDQPAMRDAACWYLTETLTAMASGQTVLVHCDAGRDRTGAFAAILAGLAAEQVGRLNANMLDAIECDYRKSESLVAAKYGRARSFLEAVLASQNSLNSENIEHSESSKHQTAGIAEFLSERCNIPPALSSQAALSFLQNKPAI